MTGLANNLVSGYSRIEQEISCEASTRILVRCVRVFQRVERVGFFERQKVSGQRHHFKITAKALADSFHLTTDLLVDRATALIFAFARRLGDPLLVFWPEDVGQFDT